MNEPGEFTLGLEGKTMRCEDFGEECVSQECLELKFICDIQDEDDDMILYLSIIVGTLVLLTCCLFVAFCILRKKLKDAQRINTEVSAAVREAEA